MAKNKQELTRVLINLIDPPGLISLEEAMRTWYYNIRPSGGLRLTKTGYQVLRSLNIEHWKFSIDNKVAQSLNKRMLLLMDRNLQYPYYIDVAEKQIVFFSSQEAMLATLYGDLSDFLKNYVQ